MLQVAVGSLRRGTGCGEVILEPKEGKQAGE